MSENTNTTTVTNNEEATKDFKIVVTSHEPFNDIVKSELIRSQDLCKLTSELFKAAYEDFYGCTFEVVPGTNFGMFCLFFDHIDRPEGSRIAVSRNAELSNIKNDTLRRTRSYQHRVSEGDRYTPTPAGDSGIKDFLFDNTVIRRNIFDKSGNVKWADICISVADESNGYGVQNQQLTKISFIDPLKVIETIYGSIDPDTNDKVAYDLKIKVSLPSLNHGSPSTNFLLQIDRLNENAVRKAAADCGLAMSSYMNIVR